MNKESILERIREIIDSDSEQQLAVVLNSYHSADLADLFIELKPEERLHCFKLIDEEKAADMIEYLTPQLQVELLGDIDEELASRLISKLPHDEAADVLGDMEEDDSENYLERLPDKFSQEVRELLTYNEETAGGLMTPMVLTVTPEMSVEDVLYHIRIKAEKEAAKDYAYSFAVVGDTQMLNQYYQNQMVGLYNWIEKIG